MAKKTKAKKLGRPARGIELKAIALKVPTPVFNAIQKEAELHGLQPGVFLRSILEKSVRNKSFEDFVYSRSA